MLSNIYYTFYKTSPTYFQITNFTRTLHKTHYEVLGVSKQCCTKDIKNAFIKLSKKYHPDLNHSADSQKQFVEVSEAYKVLSKPDSRRQYDCDLKQGGKFPYNTPPGGLYRSVKRRPRQYGYGYDDPSFWSNRARYERNFSHEESYYGVNGVRRMPNSVIALFCIFFTALGSLLQYFAIRHSVTMKREALQARSLENEQILANLKAEVARTDRETQIDIMQTKLLNNSNIR